MYWHGFDWKSLTTISSPPTTEPLFPNLRRLDCDHTSHAIPLLRLPLPSLISLRFVLGYADDLPGCQDFLNSLLELAPNIRRLGINQLRPSSVFRDFVSSYIRCWRNLEEVLCPGTSLNMDTLVHLSRMPALTRLEFITSTTSGPCDLLAIFSGLHHMRLHSPSFPSISSLLLRIRLPTIIDFIALIASCPSRQDLSSFLTSLQTFDVGHSMERLTLYNSEVLTLSRDQILDPGDVLLDLEDLRPCMAFTNLRSIDINFWCNNVGLTESGLLELATAWPRLEELGINSDWGWHTSGGITPNGLLQLLQTCRSLSQIALAVDTRGYTESPPSPTSLGVTFPSTLSINVLDSIIETESVPAISAFFTGIALCSKLYLRFWQGGEMLERADCLVYTVRWNDVYRIVEDVRS